MNTMILANRAKGQFPISIGTSIALEHLFGIDEESRGKAKQWKITDCICINVRTLIRNMLNSVKAHDLIHVDKAQLLVALSHEINLINDIVKEHSQDTMVCSFYIHTYKKLHRLLKTYDPKPPTSSKQKLLQNYEDMALSALIGNREMISTVPLEITDLYITHGRKRNVMLTHCPVDFLLVSFSTVYTDLLESHTGKRKEFFQLNTKLRDKPEHVPFNNITLQIYGDNSGMFYPAATKIRRAVTELGNQNAFNPTTSPSEFLKIIKKKADKDVIAFVNNLT